MGKLKLTRFFLASSEWESSRALIVVCDENPSSEVWILCVFFFSSVHNLFSTLRSVCDSCVNHWLFFKEPKSLCRRPASPSGIMDVSIGTVPSSGSRTTIRSDSDRIWVSSGCKTWWCDEWKMWRWWTFVFTVRESDRKPGSYVLSYYGKTGINHFRWVVSSFSGGEWKHA